jgi:hypothetical protein
MTNNQELVHLFGAGTLFSSSLLVVPQDGVHVLSEEFFVRSSGYMAQLVKAMPNTTIIGPSYICGLKEVCARLCGECLCAGLGSRLLAHGGAWGMRACVRVRGLWENWLPDCSFCIIVFWALAFWALAGWLAGTAGHVRSSPRSALGREASVCCCCCCCCFFDNFLSFALLL